ncbi:Scr1 family TA system antitoxin-like transcriptional regulator, partial [Streptomyces sp. SYSU K21746]
CPFKASRTGDVHPYAGGDVHVYADKVPQLDAVELDATHGPEFVDADIQLAKYRAQLDELESRALPPEGSRDFIRDLARRL